MRSLTIISAAFLAATSVSAEVTYGGYTHLEYQDYPPDAATSHIAFEGIIGYQSNDFYLGAGLRLFDQFDEDFEIDNDHLIWILGYQNVTLSFGDFHGAGAMVSESYFRMEDSTSSSDKTIRLDIAAENFHFSVSTFKLGRPDVDFGDTLEFGVSTHVGNNFLRAAYEVDAEDLLVITGREFETWGYHLAGHHDVDGYAIGAAYFYNFNAQLTGALQIEVNEGGYEALTAAAWYEFGGVSSSIINGAVLFGEISHEDDGDPTRYKLALRIPFGSQAPASYERADDKEYWSAYGFFDH